MPMSGSRRARGEHVVEVHHRLAHPHEDEVVHGLDAAEVQHLVEDLARGQVAAELHRARGAERARQRAAGLRGDADRAAAVAVAHHHGLDGAAVVRVEERLDRAVGAVRLVRELEATRTGPRRPAARAARPGGRSSRRSRARRWPSSATPGGRGRRARRRRRASSSSSVEVHPTYRGREMRLAKYLAHSGVASRRASEEIVFGGRVTVARRGRARPGARRRRQRGDRGRRQAGARAGRATGRSTRSTSPRAWSRPPPTPTGARRSSSWSRAGGGCTRSGGSTPTRPG